MFEGNSLALGQVGDSTGDLQNAVMGACRQMQELKGFLQHAAAGRIQRTKARDISARHPRIGTVKLSMKTECLYLTGGFYPRSNLVGAFSLALVAQIAVGQARYLDM